MAKPVEPGGGDRPSNQPRRLKKRSQLLYYLPVIERRSGERLGVLGDLSPEGLLLVSERRMDPGHRYHVRVAPDNATELLGDVELNAEIEVRWATQDANPSLYIAGTQFHGLGPEEHEIIQILLQRLGLLREGESD